MAENIGFTNTPSVFYALNSETLTDHDLLRMRVISHLNARHFERENIICQAKEHLLNHDLTRFLEEGGVPPGECSLSTHVIEKKIDFENEVQTIKCKPIPLSGRIIRRL